VDPGRVYAVDIVVTLADEAERARRHAGIAFRGPGQRRAAWVIGTPFDVWEVVQAWQDLYEDSASAQELLRLSPRPLQLAIAYYREFTSEIDASLALARRSLDDLEQAYPFIEVVRLDDT
jgi:hypothetical protein